MIEPLPLLDQEGECDNHGPLLPDYRLGFSGGAPSKDPNRARRTRKKTKGVKRKQGGQKGHKVRH